ncbi:FadR/GntR family transcriptional regulator [Caulobacter endophyticus]|uniref:FadR/GntR family transcriptional regulator n=1 Tax=Caulobacter endophyticus TaxID=2172652 RepID=UPI00240F09F7|nr:FadR/GntR family transcriptional regulator [Caulobacter endophyticus]MDG2528146.1 FadR/GntR family transcriptional regulator [Caulobacter endophyticus]
MMHPPPGISLTYGLAETLGHAIVSGAYVNADFPTEAAICEQFGASRTVTREAVKMLVAKGLLCGRPRHGTSVEPEKNWNLLDRDVLRWMLDRKANSRLLAQFAEMRLGIEPAAAALAAMKADSAALRTLGEALSRARSAAKDEEDPLPTDIAFHVAVLEATRNPFYRELRDLVQTALRISANHTRRLVDTKKALADREAVLNAISARDPAKAEKAMRELILALFERFSAAAAGKPVRTMARPRPLPGERYPDTDGPAVS